MDDLNCVVFNNFKCTTDVKKYWQRYFPSTDLPDDIAKWFIGRVRPLTMLIERCLVKTDLNSQELTSTFDDLFAEMTCYSNIAASYFRRFKLLKTLCKEKPIE